MCQCIIRTRIRITFHKVRSITGYAAMKTFPGNSVKYLLLYCAIVGTSLGLVREAYACSCAGSTIEQQIESADYAFAGLVVDVDTVDNLFLMATIQVEKVWKGAVTQQFEVWTHIRSASCGFSDPWARFEIGETFVLYAYEPDDWIDRVYTHLCTRNKKYAEAREDLAVLGGGQAPVAVEHGSLLGTGMRLDPAYPNPGVGNVTIPFVLEHPAWVVLSLYDVLGREVARLADGSFGAGAHEVVWQDGQLARGVYICRMRAGKDSMSRRLVVGGQ